MADNDTRWLVDVVNEKTGGDYSSFDVRQTLRRLTKDGTIPAREPRTRYAFTGKTDPIVKKVIAAMKVEPKE